MLGTITKTLDGVCDYTMGSMASVASKVPGVDYAITGVVSRVAPYFPGMVRHGVWVLTLLSGFCFENIGLRNSKKKTNPPHTAKSQPSLAEKGNIYLLRNALMSIRLLLAAGVLTEQAVTMKGMRAMTMRVLSCGLLGMTGLHLRSWDQPLVKWDERFKLKSLVIEMVKETAILTLLYKSVLSSQKTPQFDGLRMVRLTVEMVAANFCTYVVWAFHSSR